MTRTWRGVVYIATSMDGFIARDDGNIDFLEPIPGVEHPASIPGRRLQASYDDLMSRVDLLVMGRRTYESVLAFDSWPYPVPVVVLSTTLPVGDDARITVVRSLDEAVETLESLATRDVYVDGGRVVQAFLRADLIDEITVTRVPVLIGSGIPLFGELSHDVALSLQSVESEDGYLLARYDVVRPT